MSEHNGLPVAGYKPQSDERVTLVNLNKETEERLLRLLDRMEQEGTGDGPAFDRRWITIARAHFEQGFMALNRAVFQPGRVTLPEDKA